jgi:hypothetical protein
MYDQDKMESQREISSIWSLHFWASRVADNYEEAQIMLFILNS